MTDTSIFSRLELLWGPEMLARFKRTHIMIIGCGAVGGMALETLVRSGIGHVTVVDFDIISASNINRQIFALHSTVGLMKTDVARTRMKDINPELTYTGITRKITPENVAEFFDIRPDFVIDAMDDIEAKMAVYAYVQAYSIPIIASMGAARKTNISTIKMAPLKKTIMCPVAALIRKKLRRNYPDVTHDFRCVYSTETPSEAHAAGRKMGSVMTITGLFGLMLAHDILLQIGGIHD